MLVAAVCLFPAWVDFPAVAADPKPPVAQAKPPAALEIRGRVSAAGGGKVVAGATVRVSAEPAKEAKERRGGRVAKDAAPVLVKTSEDGSFTAKGLVGTTFTVRVEASGFAPFTVREIPPGANMRVALKAGGALAGRILDLSTKKPLARADVLVCDPDARGFGEDACRKAQTGDEGAFRISDLAPGVVSVEARAPAHARRRLDSVRIPPVNPSEPSVPQVSLFLGPGGRVAGRVVDDGGKPVAGVEISSRSSASNVLTMIRAQTDAGDADSVRTDEKGKFALEGLAAGSRYTVTASKDGYSSAKAGPYTIEGGTDVADAEMKIRPSATLRAKVVDPDGKAVPDVEVSLEPAERRGFARMRLGGAPENVVKGSGGEITVKELDEGTYNVTLEAPGWDTIEREGVRLRAGEATDLGTLVAREGKGFSGRVTSRSGEPVAGAEVRAMWGMRGKFETRTATTKEDGRYQLVGLEAKDEARVQVSKAGFAQATKESVGFGETAVDFVLERTGSVVGKVVLAGGEAPGGFRVATHREAQEDARGAMFRFVLGRQDPEKIFSDPSGAFRVDDIDPGTWTIEAIAGGKVPAKKTGVRIDSEQVVDLGTLVLEDGKSLRGRVLDARDDSPVAGASVRASVPQGLSFDFNRVVESGGAMTDLDGTFTIEGLDAGSRNLSAEHADYATAEIRVEIPADGEPAEAVLRLLRGGTLTGVVRDAQKQPIAGTSIVLGGRMFGMDTKAVETGPDGRYTFERLAPGDYNAMRPPDGSGRLVLRMGAKNVTIAEGQTTTLDFDEAPKISLSGRVLRGQQPVGGAMLIFLGEGGGAGLQTTQSDESGAYQVGLDHAGKYNVMVQSGAGGGGMRFASGGGVAITVPDQAEAKVDVVLSAGGIQGRISDADGNALTDAVVSARRDGAEAGPASMPSMGQSDAGGAYSLDGLGPGTYRLSASANGYQTAESYPVVLTDASPAATVDLRLEKGTSLRGKVVDTQGRGIAGAMVFAAAAGTAGTGARPATTDVNGDFVATAPSSGAMDVTAVAPGWAPARAAGIVATGGDEPAVVLQASFGGRIRVQVQGSNGAPVPGIQASARPSLPYPGSDFAGFMNRPQPTAADGSASLSLLAPGTYEVSIPDRTDVPALQVSVAEGGEALASFRLP
jgi:protocatechuate 3,4-dioxygenase beta subunit